MLLELYVRNFAIIEEATVSFGKGLNILTGETGAGKSLLVEALELMLGGRARSEWIRSGADEVEVQAIFDISSNPEVRAFLAETGYPQEEDLYLRRTINRSGKNRVFVNDRPSSLGMVTQLCERLVDIHGQHEHQSLLRVARHREVLDIFGDCVSLQKKVADLYSCLKKRRESLSRFEESLRRAREEQELLTHQVEELSRASLKSGEEEELDEEKRRLLHAEKLGQVCIEGEALLYSQKQSIVDQVALLQKRIEDAEEIDPVFKTMREHLETARGYLEEAARMLQSHGQRIHHDPQRLEEVEERLGLLHQLKRKYRGTVEDLINQNEGLKERLSLITHSESKLKGLAEAVHEKEAHLRDAALELSKAREKAARLLSTGVEKELQVLGMKKNRFRADVQREVPEESEKNGGCIHLQDYTISPTGIDRVEFLILTNPGEPFRPLHRIASGGELSRIMLAIRNVLHQSDALSTLVFDEVDVGIGGAEAEVVGSRLKALSHSFQVLCITHLPQIAAFADTHIKVSKRIAKDHTEILVESLDGQAREREIARMLGGIEITQKTIEHAREVLQRHSKGSL